MLEGATMIFWATSELPVGAENIAVTIDELLF